MTITLTKCKEEIINKAEESQPKQAQTIRWSVGGMIQYLDGWGWGVDVELNTLCLGGESAVKEAIANPKLKCSDPCINQIIELEREIIRGIENGDTRTKINGTKLRAPKPERPDSKRIRPLRAVRYQRPNLRPVKA